MGSLGEEDLCEELVTRQEKNQTGWLSPECEDGNSSSDPDDDVGLQNMMDAVRVLLEGLGEDLMREGLLKTPLRVARALRSATKGYQLSAQDIIGGALFPESGPDNNVTGFGGGSGGMVVVQNIDCYAICEACLLPFKVCCHIAYIPCSQRVVGLSKLPRVAELFANRLQSPERFANEVADALFETFKPLGVAIAAQCSHYQLSGIAETCDMPKLCSQNSCIAWSSSSVFAGKGKFGHTGSELWSEFMAILQLGGIDLQLPCMNGPTGNSFCPFSLLDGKPVSPFNGFNSVLACAGLAGLKGQLGCFLEKLLEVSPKAAFGVDKHILPSMVAAVESLIRSVGEDPNRDELKLTPLRFVLWLLVSTQGSRASDFMRHCSISDSIVDKMNAETAELSVPFCSQCEHHLLPFSGVAHVGCSIEQGGQHIEWPLLLKLVSFYSYRLQVQERLTRQIAEAVMSFCGMQGVMVVIEATHVCMMSRGVKKVGTSTATIAALGSFATDSKARALFLQKIMKRNRFTGS